MNINSRGNSKLLCRVNPTLSWGTKQRRRTERDEKMKALLPGDLANHEETKKGSCVLTRMALGESGFSLFLMEGEYLRQREKSDTSPLAMPKMQNIWTKGKLSLSPFF